MSPTLEDFDYHLPPELVAAYPAQPRDAARLMVVDRATGALNHAIFRELPHFLEPGEVLVVNDTRVFPARLPGVKESGGKVELLLHHLPVPEDGGEPAAGRAEAGYRGRLRPGVRLSFGAGLTGEVLALPRPGVAEVRLVSSRGGLVEAVQAAGQIPLPPYIRRPPTAADQESYQTMFARKTGAIACPTAGLHFTPRVLAALAAQGVETVAVTLHVGPGTFTPVRTRDYTAHVLAPEYYELAPEAARRLNAAKAAGRRVVAVGTTTVRVLESCWAEEGFRPGAGWCDLYIYPGYRFRAVDRLLTNFHLPRSTLLLLVSAFAGRDLILRAYAEAVRQRYRFYSYGDCMLIR
ncbi:MAG: tRNA preQ1(34) S-adenosylmethionine ribosyltransferase-isomerase QueA [Syntrophobacterales bacterium]|nr:tRNA preQ1(34) S-adenosylmethionine ribosyltransferase-isomerase QueA [Syntrophobacterales bacterium]